MQHLTLVLPLTSLKHRQIHHSEVELQERNFSNKVRAEIQVFNNCSSQQVKKKILEDAEGFGMKSRNYERILDDGTFPDLFLATEVL